MNKYTQVFKMQTIINIKNISFNYTDKGSNNKLIKIEGTVNMRKMQRKG